MAEHTAFFYGTLMAPKILYRVCFGTTTPQDHQKQFIRIRPALLHGFRRHRVKHVDYPGITPIQQSSVLGTYVTGLSPQDLYRLDCFEGDEYKRRDVKVQVLKGSVARVQADAASGKQVGQDGEVEEEVTTQTYVYLDSGNLEEKEWDFEEFKKDKMSAWTLESSDEYHDIPYEQGNDGTGGRGVGGEITRQLHEDGSAKGPEADEVARAVV